MPCLAAGGCLPASAPQRWRTSPPFRNPRDGSCGNHTLQTGKRLRAASGPRSVAGRSPGCMLSAARRAEFGPFPAGHRLQAGEEGVDRVRPWASAVCVPSAFSLSQQRGGGGFASMCDCHLPSDSQGRGEILASTQDPSPSPPASCYPPSPAWTIPLPPPPSLICSPHGSLSDLYKRESRCCLQPCDDSHHTQKEIHIPCLSPSTPAVSYLPDLPMSLVSLLTATLASLVGPEHPKLLRTSGPSHFLWRMGRTTFSIL